MNAQRKNIVPEVSEEDMKGGTLSPSLRGRHLDAGACLKKGSEARGGSRAKILWGLAKGTGCV